MPVVFTIPCSWQMFGKARVVMPEGSTLEDAIEKLKSAQVGLPDGNYLDDSFQIDHEALNEMTPDDYTEAADEEIG